VAAVRSMALRLAGQSPHFGPFLADRAERALSGRDPERRVFFPDAVRAAGLARILAASYRRDSAALLFDLPECLSAAHERAIVSAAAWLAHHGGFAVWLTGAPLASVDSVDTVTVGLPRPTSTPNEDAEVQTRPSIGYPPLPGRPRSDSPAEQALEAALATRDWAAGRRWNEMYQSNALAESYRLDLVFHAYRCVVEIDGPDHLRLAKYEADRRRDVRLQLDGYAVLRFTNGQVLADVGAVASHIQQFLSLRTPREGTADGKP
jgi:very-short-patch-repair endonuclease